jgi:hypothetical protein
VAAERVRVGGDVRGRLERGDDRIDRLGDAVAQRAAIAPRIVDQRQRLAEPDPGQAPGDVVERGPARARDQHPQAAIDGTGGDVGDELRAPRARRAEHDQTAVVVGDELLRRAQRILLPRIGRQHLPAPQRTERAGIVRGAARRATDQARIVGVDLE